MNVLFFSRLFHPHIGGVEKHVLEIAKILIRKGHNLTVVCESHDSGIALTEKKDGIKIYRISVGKNNWFKKFKVWKELWKLRNLIRKSDIVHCHDVFFWYLPFRFLLPFKKIFTTFHGYETKFPPSKKAVFVRKISEKLSWGNICVGDYIEKRYGTAPTFTTYGGVRIANHKLQLTNKYKVRNIECKILFIGRLEEDTGLPIYLKTLDLLKKRGIRFTLEACGDGSLRKTAEKYGKVYGFVKDLSQHMEKADIVFASSYLSILEAMMCRKLVFAVYNNSLKEDYLRMCPFAKWIIIENSQKKIADKIQYFIKQFERKEKMLGEGYRWASEQTWEKVADIYLELWRVC
jgi:glycosyltransferase involved in cell wall biosynthesis